MSGFAKFIIYAFLIISGTFSLAATHDYLSWNRARWKALNHLVHEKHISPRSIDGGFEFNGWHNYDPQYRYQAGKSWWWVHQDDYIISFGPITGYQKVETYHYSRWLPGGKGKIFILHKTLFQ